MPIASGFKDIKMRLYSYEGTSAFGLELAPDARCQAVVAGALGG